MDIIRWVSLALIFRLCNSLAATEDGPSRKQHLSVRRTSTLTCDINELDVGDHVIQCFPEQIPPDTVAENTECAAILNIQNKTEVVIKKCVNGKWKDARLGCYNAPANIKQAPRFGTPCTPIGIQNTYTVNSGETSTIVAWSDPVASDPDGSISSLTQTYGIPSGGQFDGATSGKTHFINYIATDNDGLTASCYFSFEVKIQTCTIAAWPNNGRRYCSLYNYLGSVCEYRCNTGYEVSGSSQITCQGSPIPVWSSLPSCEKKICPSPPFLENGGIYCADSTYEYLVTCQISCNFGYQLSGTYFSYTTCQADGTWSYVENAVCLDNVPPELSCKTPQIFYADRSSTSVTVDWTLPTVTDNLDPNPTLKQTGGKSIGSTFHVGSSFVTYTAKDKQDNESPKCSIEIRVEETTCQHPTDILEDTNMVYNCSGSTYVYGTECSLSCSYNLPLIGSDLILCERNDSQNSTGLDVGAWSWGTGEKPFCNHTDCPALDPPVNGALSPNFVGTTRIYTMLCNSNFDIPNVGTGFTGMFYCQNDGTYVPSIDPPDCIVPRSPFGMRLPAEIYYYSGDCSDPATKENISSQVQQIFDTTVDTFFRSICPTTNKCTASNLNIICGPTGKKKRSVSNTLKGPAIFGLYSRRQKRNNPTGYIEFEINIQVDPREDLLENLNFMHDILLNEVKPGLQDLVNNDTFTGDYFNTDDNSFSTSANVNLQCEDGHLLQQFTCVPCPSGYFLNPSSGCELCSLGNYSDEPALTSCKACPIGYSTLATGSKNEDKCLEFCPVGKSSATGLVPCTVCPVGYYQSETGQTNCTQCPTGTTEFAGSISSTACQAFHLLIDNTGEDVTGTALSTGLMDLTLMLWVKRFSNLSANAQVILKSGEDDLIVLNFTDTIGVNLPGSSFYQTVGSLTSLKWSHITVTWDTANTELSVYTNGQLEVSVNTLTPPSSPLITDGSLLLQSIGDTGVFVADIHIEDRVVPLSEIVSTTNSCWTDRAGDVFGMRDFRSKTLTGVQLQTPLSCDPIDECATNPCNNHSCVNGINTYTCYCSSGWSGVNCDTPPDYCIDSGCANGATCVSGNQGFTCTCPIGYSGDHCEVAPVNGGWSEWTAWETCSVTCNGGTQSRSRSCDSPEPSPQGTNCLGDTTETQTCNQDSCPTCPTLRGFRLLTNCTVEEATGIETCRMYCRDGYDLPSSLASVEYTCGFSTNFTWSPNNNPPNCEKPESPFQYTLSVNSDTDKTIAADDETQVKQSITDNLSGLQCVQDNLCEASVAISNSKKKRSVGSTISLTLIVEMTETGALNIQDYIETSTISPSLQEVIDAINSLESTASYINTSSSSIFDVTVNGITYTSSQSTLTITGNITCPTGQTVTEGVCISCPEGTYYNDGYCSYCNKGTYSSSSGQTSCTACPYGLSTTTIGSFAASQCTESVDVTTTTSKTTESNNSDNTAMYVGIAVGAVGLVVLLGVCAFIIHKKISKQTRLRKTRRVASMDCLHSQARLHNGSTQINVREVTYSEHPKKPVFVNPTYFNGAEHDALEDIRPSFSPPPPYSFEDDEDTSLPYKY